MAPDTAACTLARVRGGSRHRELLKPEMTLTTLNTSLSQWNRLR